MVMDEELKATMERNINRRRRTDFAEAVKTVLNSPIHPGEVTDPDENIPLEELVQKNVTVMTRVIAKHAMLAADGDPKSTDLLLKYGGYTPPVEHHVSMELPTFIDDITEDRPIPKYDKDGKEIKDE